MHGIIFPLWAAKRRHQISVKMQRLSKVFPIKVVIEEDTDDDHNDDDYDDDDNNSNNDVDGDEDSAK